MDDRTKTEGWPGEHAEPRHAPPHEAPIEAPPPRKGGSLGFVVGLLIVVAAVAAGWWLYQRPVAGNAPRAGRATVPPVETAAVTNGDINVTINALGTVTSLATITIKSQISGQLVAVYFKESDIVERGKLLAEIDSRPYQLALAQAEGALKRDQGLLESAQKDLERYRELSKTNAIPRQQYDQQVALVKQYEGNIITDQAQIDAAKLNITYCHITAPGPGRLGLRMVDPGNYVTPGDATGLVVLTQLAPISVLFTTAEDNLPAVQKRLKAGATLQVTAFDRSGATRLAVGTVSSLDNQIDTTTGTVKLRAQFANTDGALFPNQFVNTQLLVDVLHDVPVVQSRAIQRGAPGTFVYLFNPQYSTVAIRKVVLGPADGDRVAVTSGLNAGDIVVVDGADKLRDGIKITVRSGPGAGAAPATPPNDGQQRRRRDRPN
jgi:multidrug efflux system membrane fusion protein